MTTPGHETADEADEALYGVRPGSDAGQAKVLPLALLGRRQNVDQGAAL